MKSDCLNELRTSIIDAIKNGNVEQEYPKWIFKCRVDYNISSYTLQLLIIFYTRYLNEKETLIPANNVDCFIKYSKIKKDEKEQEPISQTNCEETNNIKKNTKYNYVLKFRYLWILVIVFPILLIMTLMANTKIVKENKTNIIEIPVNKISELLDSPTITLDSILATEKIIEAQNIKKSKEINSRLIALKHIYISGFMAENHSVQNLKNIYSMRANEFSPAQQEIMNWYLKQDTNTQNLWEICDKASSFTDFKRKVKKNAQKYKSNNDNHE